MTWQSTYFMWPTLLLLSSRALNFTIEPVKPCKHEKSARESIQTTP